MNQAIRNSWVVALAMFALILGSLTYVQFFAAEDLNKNTDNRRSIYRDFGENRGSILVDGKAVAESVPSNDEFNYQRVYNNPELYSQLTGFFNLNGTSQLETAMNEELSGNSPQQFYDKLVQVFSGAQSQGASVELTIDPELQQLAYDLIPDGQKGSIVMMDPKTGDILAMVSKPTYDTNALAVHDTGLIESTMAELTSIPGLSPYINPATESLLAPGSVFKLVDTAAALESGKYDADSVIPNPQEFLLPGTNTYLPNFVTGACSSRSEADFAFALAQSCNTVFAQVALELGQDNLAAQAEKFGFDTPLTIPTPVVPSHFPDNEDQAQLALSSIGQGSVTATPLQVAMISAAIANNGEQMTPNLVRSVRAPDLSVIDEPKPTKLNTSISPDTARQLTEWMVGVVDNGSASAARIPGVKVAGKTGTAEVEGRGDNAWFTGFAPADDPQVVISVVMEDVDLTTGAQLTTPSAQKLLEAVLNK
ncbi:MULTISPECIES: peptidoglycan D,D-transpeptidase FtsI family protein [unclassified Arthrobacter]|uniref:peptidoglycan D,D-transpeptidase FtsI family protein n=1 Tax=unclassified Arthrobacter TaxID=235627 RepID=UPI001D15452F|nr:MULTISPECIES: penicillin-binding protein 2 [unclassified Arthrobacter]MCC3275637.1 penicillin-binding protein 2 [Arthrobacter sp. zg-Y20]MCC9177077.1 penicillin-binding protein 2 [Arthrobacter sp. zg-Y750]MDK1315794.1 penicillin-binding protein 2 [Arthrobacter sp. zg.Y20]MDK1326212.1 penicillin-binding protein 2 [Arthrobacter sp. zg-Y1143]WIB06198.1 penicillin-binding protein 2 [Arthrobacter sp. zg-Y20]